MMSLYCASVPNPSAPGSPLAPLAPGSPLAPLSPGSPLAPGSPGSPLAPGSPFGPGSPGSPFAPFAPATSIRSCISFSVITCPLTNRCLISLLFAIRYPPILVLLPKTASPNRDEASLGSFCNVYVHHKVRVLKDGESELSNLKNRTLRCTLIVRFKSSYRSHVFSVRVRASKEYSCAFGYENN